LRLEAACRADPPLDADEVEGFGMSPQQDEEHQ
jgi:hypothetical protein